MINAITNYIPEIIQALTVGLITLLWWAMKRFFVTREDFEKCRADFDARLDSFVFQNQETQVEYELVQHRLHNLPSKDDFAKLDKTLEVVRTDIKGQKDLFVRLENQVNDINAQLRTLSR